MVRKKGNRCRATYIRDSCKNSKNKKKCVSEKKKKC